MKKWEDLLSFSAIVLALVLLNLNADRFFFRLDLTEEKRYSVSEATQQLLAGLTDNIYIEVYLEGDLNAEFKRLQKSIRENLDEFRLRSGGLIDYAFIDPNEAPNPQARQQFYQQLVSKGLPYTTLVDMVEGEQKQKIIFPGAILTYGNEQKPVLLLKGNKAASPQEQLNQSIEGIEYELATAIQQLTLKQKKKIAIVQGHQELNPAELQDLTASLNEFYKVDFIELGNQPLETYRAVVVAQPKTPFSDLDKFDLDQYVMKGGSLLFVMDKVQMNLDSIPKGGAYAFGYDLNIEDLIFRYGVRLNNDLLQDQQAGLVEIYVGQRGDQPNIRKLPWPYFIYLNTYSKHPMVRNLDAIYAKFANSLDTVAAPGITKTPLVFTSKYSRRKGVPGIVSFDEIKEVRDQSKFNEPYLPVAYLLEGSFRSYFAARFAPAGTGPQTVIKEGKPAKVMVVADGDIIRNEFNRQTGKPEPIDYDKHRQESLSNKEFMLNALAYLTDANGLITSRTKEVRLRLLDELRIREEKLQWQLLNIVVPVLLIVFFGLVRFYWRKRKYEN